MMSQMMFLRMNERIGRVRRHESNTLYDEHFVSPKNVSYFEKWYGKIIHEFID